jgi:hypothetical protein
MTHPITPPEDVIATILGSHKPFEEMILDAARWGADQELEACCEAVRKYHIGAENLDQFLQQERRPNGLKDKALDALDRVSRAVNPQYLGMVLGDIETIRTALGDGGC